MTQSLGPASGDADRLPGTDSGLSAGRTDPTGYFVCHSVIFINVTPRVLACPGVVFTHSRSEKQRGDAETGDSGTGYC